MFTLAQERPEDWWEVEALYDSCFAPGRAALSSYRLRDARAPETWLCTVARDESGFLGGAIRYWAVEVAGLRALLLGPIAVHATAQGEGLGGALIRTTLSRARDAGETRVLLVGDAPYYARFGFHPLRDVAMPPPTNPERVLGVSLVEGAWSEVTGRVTPPQETPTT